MSVHRIRLNSFWEVKPTERGVVEHRRRFGQPRQHAPNETHWLVGTVKSTTARLLLNSQLLGDLPNEAFFEFHVTGILQPRNELLIELTTEGAITDLALEIRGK